MAVPKPDRVNATPGEYTDAEQLDVYGNSTFASRKAAKAKRPQGKRLDTTEARNKALRNVRNVQG